jgi:hypothetical protein
VKYLGFFKYGIIPSVNRNDSTSSFESLISFSYLISLARNSSAILNKSADSGHSCLIPETK